MEQNPVTIVSCFYELANSKHSREEYIRWITWFLEYVDQPIVMFGDGFILTILNAIRKEANLEGKLFTVQLPLSECKYSSADWIEKWNLQKKLSNYPDLHNQELFRVWANKSYFVEKAIERNPFGSEKFVWCDAGCWRDPIVAQYFGKGWPVANKILPGKMHFLTMYEFQEYIQKANQSNTLETFVETYTLRAKPTIGGTILLGDKEAWTKIIPFYDEVLKLFIEKNKFAGDDQQVLLYTALWMTKMDSKNKPIFFKAPKKHGFCRIENYSCGDIWFAFQQHFSNATNFHLEEYTF